MIVLDLDGLNVPPHNCIHVVAQQGRRAHVSNREALDVRHDFRQEVQLRVPRRLKQRVRGPLFVRFFIWRRADAPADGDNLQKEFFDAITQAGIWADDREVVDWHGTVMEQGPKVKPRVIVRISAFDCARALEELTELQGTAMSS